MLLLLRTLSTAGLLYVLWSALQDRSPGGPAGDLTGSFYLVIGVALAIFCAVTWAPYFGEKLAEPLTMPFTGSSGEGARYRLVRLIQRMDHRGRRHLTLCLCFVEGVHRPWLPEPFWIGLKNARPGSWLEKAFAREVFRFDNAERCAVAWRVLKRHGVTQLVHGNPSVCLVLASLDREVKASPAVLQVPAADAAPALERNTRIKLWERPTKPKEQ